MEKLKTSIIGLGVRNREDHLPAVLNSQSFDLDSFCEIDDAKLHSASSEFGIDGFNSLDTLLKDKKPDVAIVAVPHHAYISIIERLASAGVHIIKEKPFATSLEEAVQIAEIVKKGRIEMMITLQRRHNPIFKAFQQLRKHIGRIFSVEGRYTLNIDDLESGWRSSKDKAGGGALIDMGYHYIDLLIWYFGLPDLISARMTSRNKEGQDYNVEDTANLLFDYQYGDKKSMIGNVLISRVYPRKEEKLTAIGTHGIIELERGKIGRFDCQGNELEILKTEKNWPIAGIDQIEAFASMLKGQGESCSSNYLAHFEHMAFVDAAYESHNNKKTVKPHQLLKRHNILL